MTKNELAYKIGSQGLKPALKLFLKIWVFGMLVVIPLLIGTVSYFTVNSVRSKIIPAFRENLRLYATRSEKIRSKSYSVQSVRKRAENSLSFLGYEVQSSAMKSKDNKPVSFLVAKEYEEQFLQEVKSQKLVLEYFEGHEDKPLHIYPGTSLWPEILNKMESDDLDAYKSAINSYVQQGSDQNKEFDSVNHLAWLILPALVFLLVWRRQKKRRLIFLKHFKKEDLLNAEKCTIEKHKLMSLKLKTGNVVLAYGQAYKVLNHKDIYVIYNGSKSKRANGFLLKYEDHYFFIHEKWVPRTEVIKAA
jgi:hypothetical protein